MSIKQIFPEFNGASAYGGALRFCDPIDVSWRESWGTSYGTLEPDLKLFASDAFGVMYGLDNKNQVVIFWSETGELESLRINQEEFYTLIKEDPEGTINYSLFVEATKVLGGLSLEQHFAFIIELALGGELSVNNLAKMDAIAHMKMLGRIALQIRNIPPGTKFDKVTLEK